MSSRCTVILVLLPVVGAVALGLVPDAQARSMSQVSFGEVVLLDATAAPAQATLAISLKPRAIDPRPILVRAVASLGWHVLWGADAGAGGLADQPLAMVADAAASQALTIQVQRSKAAMSTPAGPDVGVVELRVTDPVLKTAEARHRVAVDFRGPKPALLSEGALEAAYALSAPAQSGPGYAAMAPPARAPDALRHLPPWANPEVPASIRDALAAEAAAGEPLTTVSLPLTASGEPGPPAAGGCSGAGTSSAVGLLCGLVVLAALGYLRRRARWKPGLLTLLALSLLVTGGTPVHAESRSVYGYVSFWDTRSAQSNVAGSRHLACDPQITGCTPSWGYICCFHGVPRVEIELRRGSPWGPTVDVAESASNGFFLLTDTAHQAVPYYMRVNFRRQGFPAKMEIAGQTGSAVKGCWMPAVTLDAAYTYLPNVPLNSAGDQTAPCGDLGAIWTSTHETFAALSAEGEDRYRREHGSSNDYDLIRVRYFPVPGGGIFAACDLSEIYVPPSQARGNIVAHEVGHILHGRVVGCAGGGAAFPTYWDGAGRWDTGEGNALGEATAEIAQFLWRWDPDVVTMTDMLASQAPCAAGETYTPDALANVNDLSAERNSAYGLWEWLDTDTSGADDYADLIDLTLSDVDDALVVFSEDRYDENGDLLPPGTNRSAAEQFENPVPGSTCNNSDNCAVGQICLADGQCHAGDVHGCNLRDWAHHVAELTAGVLEHELVTTMIASPCVGRFDDLFPYDGGYRFD